MHFALSIWVWFYFVLFCVFVLGNETGNYREHCGSLHAERSLTNTLWMPCVTNYPSYTNVWVFLGADAKKMTNLWQKRHMSNEPLLSSTASSIIDIHTKWGGDPRTEALTLPGEGKENTSRRDDLLSGVLEKDLEILLVYKEVQGSFEGRNRMSIGKSKWLERAEMAGVSGWSGRRREQSAMRFERLVRPGWGEPEIPS